MKTIILAIAILFIGIAAKAQSTATTTVPENQTFNLDQNKFNPKDSNTLTSNSQITSNKAISNGNVYPVFVSKKGKLFIILKSKKTGNYYKKYLN